MIRGAALRRVWWRWWFPPTITIVVLFNTLLILCWSFNIWSWQGLKVYRAMSRECHPAWRDYHFGKVQAGDDVNKVITLTQPMKVEHRGRWTFLNYQQPGFTAMGPAVAYDGRMVFAVAMSCCWTRLFFDELTEAQSWELLGRSRDDPKRLGIAPVVR